MLNDSFSFLVTGHYSTAFANSFLFSRLLNHTQLPYWYILDHILCRPQQVRKEHLNYRQA